MPVGADIGTKTQHQQHLPLRGASFVERKGCFRVSDMGTWGGVWWFHGDFMGVYVIWKEFCGIQWWFNGDLMVI